MATRRRFNQHIIKVRNPRNKRGFDIRTGYYVKGGKGRVYVRRTTYKRVVLIDRRNRIYKHADYSRRRRLHKRKMDARRRTPTSRIW